MSAQSQVWVWRTANGDKDGSFQHPSDIPFDDEALAKARFVDRVRGPQLARISPASLLQTKGNVALIAENGATREVPKSEILPWYEGLLLLEELDGGVQTKGERASWCNEELRAVLEQERGKFKNNMLSSALYTEKRLISTAVTGTRFLDADEKEWAYRRENLRADDKMSFAEGEEEGGFYKIRDIVGYLPPWEAFCHEKCGFYQDFYQVRWDFPHSEVNYSRVENGADMMGATWEPDECIPAHLDPLRIAAKRAWIKKRREREQRVTDTRAQTAPKRDPPPAAAAAKRPPPEVAPPPEVFVKPVKRARVKRDGAALERDLFRSARGHDFSPGDFEKSSGGVRTGWPKKPEEYPKGFGCADPPGFCFEGCDCMDDQRPQRPWETHKAWLEDTVRTASANSAIEALSNQTRFVRRRGQVTKMCFFETPQTVLPPNQAQVRAALDLASSIERAVMSVLKSMPLPALQASKEPAAHVPARVFLFEDLDYEPLRFDAALHASGELPKWLRVDADDGHLSVEDGQQLQQPLQMKVEFRHAEGVVGAVPCGIVQGGPPLWKDLTPALAQRFEDSNQCALERGTRECLQEHFAEVYDFGRGSARERTLGEWLEVMARILRMLRSVAIANVALTAVHRAPLQRASITRLAEARVP